MSLNSNEIDQYCNDHSSPQSSLLQEIERKTHLFTIAPQMLSGHIQGRLLSMISSLKCPNQILEIGTFTGYGTLCLAEGLDQQGELHTIEINEEIIDFTQKFINQSPYANQIHFHCGDALDLIPKMNKKWDLVFIDAGKVDYPMYYELLVPLMNKNGIMIADNVLWSGKVLKNSTNPETVALQEFNKIVTQDPRTENFMLPIRDGLMVVKVL